VIAVDKPELVGNGCELNVQWLLWLHVAQKDDRGRVQLSGSLDDVAKLTVWVAAE
jgi:hypothetical protein